MIDIIKSFFKKEEEVELEIVEDYGDSVLVKVKENAEKKEN
jgi:hypothetical protein